MWKQGVLFALLDFIVTLPSLLYLMAVSGAEWMVGMPFLRLIPTAMQVCYVLNFIQMVIRGLFAVYWYKKKANAAFTAFMTAAPKARNAAMPWPQPAAPAGQPFLSTLVFTSQPGFWDLS